MREWVASHWLLVFPVGILAAIAIAAAAASVRRRQVLKSIELVPSDRRSSAAEKAGVAWDRICYLAPRDRLRVVLAGYWLIAFLCSLAAMGIVSVSVVIRNYELTKALGALEQEKRAKTTALSQRSEIQRRHDELLERNAQLDNVQARIAGGVSFAVELVYSREPQDPVIEALVEHLNKAILATTAQPSIGDSLQEDLAVRSAQATIANDADQFALAELLVTERDESYVLREASRVLEVRARSLCGQRKWQAALARCQQILVFRPERYDIAALAASCLSELGESKLAAREFDAIVKRLAAKETTGRQTLHLGLTYSNRGCVRLDLGRIESAIEDFDRAISVMATTKEARPHHIATPYLNRGKALCAAGKYADGWADFDIAIQLLEESQDRGLADVRPALSVAYYNRGLASQDRGDTFLAMSDMERARSELLFIWDGRRPEIAKGIADVLNAIAGILTETGDYGSAITVADECLAMRSLIAQTGDVDSVPLIEALSNRATALSFVGRLEESRSGHDRAVRLLEELVYVSGRTELLDKLATAYANRGLTAQSSGDTQLALRDFGCAIEASRERMSEEPAGAVRKSLALQLLNRGKLRNKLSDYPGAFTDLNESIQICDKIAKEGQEEVRRVRSQAFYTRAIARASQTLGQANVGEGPITASDLTQFENPIVVNTVVTDLKISKGDLKQAIADLEALAGEGRTEVTDDLTAIQRTAVAIEMIVLTLEQISVSPELHEPQ